MTNRTPLVSRRRRARFFEFVEKLELRRLLSSPVEQLSYHNDASSTGQNLNETILTPANVGSSNFGLLTKVSLDGQVYAQPLFKANVNVTRGAAPGIHDVLYVATQHGSLYALDANDGTILWQDSFLNVSNPTNLTATTGVTPIPASDVVNTADVAPEIGILATPAIDPSANVIYLDASTKEVRSEFATTNKHYVQRLWAVSLNDGSALRSTVIGDTIMNSTAFSSYLGYEYVSGPWVNGTGNNAPINDSTTHQNTNADGWIVNPNDSTSIFAGTTPSGTQHIAFNALLQMNRPAVTLVNGNIYLGYASHGDDGPYYGWLLGFNAQTFAPSGVFVTVPNFKNIAGDRADFRAQAGIWMSGDRIASDGTYLYVTTGNGIFDETDANFDANGFPIDHDYGDAVLKIALDPGSTQSSQNGNGWGLTVADYFVPSNQLKLNQIDADMGSGGITLIDSNAIPGHPHMLMTGGKEGRVYLIDRDNMGKFNFSYPENATTSPYPDPLLYDRVLGESQGNATNSQTHKFYSTGSYFNGKFLVALSTDPGWQFNLSTFATGTIPPNTQTTTKDGVTSLATGSRGATYSISANGTGDGIYWSLVNNASAADDLQAYSAAAFTGGATVAPLFDSNSLAANQLTIANPVSGQAAAVGVKFNMPTVVNGLVYAAVGTKNAGSTTNQFGGIIIYGLHTPTLSTPTSLAASATGSDSIHLTWSRGAGDQESITRIERSADGVGGWTAVGTVGNGSTSYDDTGLAAGTQYFYRVIEVYGTSSSSPSNVANATTTNSTAAGVTSVSASTANGPYGVGAGISIQVNFSDMVNVTGTPQLALNSGGGANYLSGSGTSTLTFLYVVSSGQNSADLDYTSIGALSLNGGTIKDLANQDANLVLPSPGSANSLGGSKAIVIDSTPPTAAFGGGSPANGATSFTFTITYADSGAGVDPNSFDSGDITVTGPGGFSGNATFISNAGNVATYSLTGPGGSWDPVDNGTYTVSQNASQVRDLVSNYRAAGTISTFSVLLGNVVYVSNLPFAATPTSGFGPVERDMSNGNTGAGDGTTITLNGVTYAKGLGMHATDSTTTPPSPVANVLFNLDGAYTRFLSDVGVDDEVTNAAASVDFQVFCDGVKMYDSGVMGATSATQSIDLSVDGVRQLQLVVTDAGDGKNSDHADWAGARLTPNTGPSFPVAHYEFDDGSGTQVSDLSSNANHGTASGTTTWSPGLIAKGAMTFDGSTGVVTVPNAAQLNPTSALTLAAWVNATSWTGGNRKIIQKGDANDQYFLGEVGSSLTFNIAGVGNVIATLPSTGAWHHVAGTYDGSKMKLYVDGTVVASLSATGAIPVTSSVLALGSRNGGAASEHFNGMLDDVRIYNRALNNAEMSNLAHPISINFQVTGAPLPSGYLEDDGLTYAGRGNGQTYGWSVDQTDNARDRNNASQPDQRLDTLNQFHAGANWQIALPNGNYRVYLSDGDPSNSNFTPTLNMEGVNYYTNLTMTANAFVFTSWDVAVTDGKLTIDQGADAEKDLRPNYIQIYSLNADVTPPGILNWNFNFQTGPSLITTYSENVSSVNAGNLQLTNLTTGAVVPSNFIGASHGGASTTFTFPGYPGGVLPDGNYHAAFIPGSVADNAGNPIQPGNGFDFYVLAGDANRDRHVDAADQAILTANFGLSNKPFSQGDFDYNQTVNANDQAILTANMNVWLPPQGAVVLPGSSDDDSYLIKKESAALTDIYFNAAPPATPTFRLMIGAASSLSFTGDTGNDVLTIDASNGNPLGAIPFAYDGGGDNDTLAIVGTSGADAVTFNANSVTLGPTTITHTNLESRTFDGDGGGDTVTINAGSVALASTQKLASLTIQPGGALDLVNHSLIVDYSGNSPIGSWNGSAYTGLTGLIQSGGIVSSAAATSALYAVAIAEASQVAPGGTFAGQSVDGSAVCLKFTYAGDANLDGKINIDDYVKIDSALIAQLNGYYNGDFNLDGKVNIDDYLIIDNNIGTQGAPL